MIELMQYINKNLRKHKKFFLHFTFSDLALLLLYILLCYAIFILGFFLKRIVVELTKPISIL